MSSGDREAPLSEAPHTKKRQSEPSRPRQSAQWGYLDLHGPLHRLDPRAKVAATLLLLGAVFAVDGWVGYLVLALFLTLAALYGRIPLRRLAGAVQGVGFLLLFTVVVNGFFTPGEAVARLGPLTLTDRGLARGIVLGMRLVLIVGATTLLTAVTKPLDLAYGLGWAFGPLKYLRLPVSELAMVMSIALRFIPVLSEEARRIQLAQKARGIEIDDKPLSRAASLVSIIVPLFAGALRQADELGLALEARGYVPGRPRGRLYPLRFGPADFAGLALCASAALAALLWM